MAMIAVLPRRDWRALQSPRGRADVARCVSGVCRRRAAPPPRKPPPIEGRRQSTAPDKIDAEKLFGAIVKVPTRSVPDARSADSLGNEREGTGVVIGDNGLVLTIGYLIVEADDVKITDAKGRTLPARVVGYDHASGFGLVRTSCRWTRTPDRARRFRQDRGARPGA